MAMRESEVMTPLALISSWLSAAEGLLLTGEERACYQGCGLDGGCRHDLLCVCECLVSFISSTMHGFPCCCLLCSINLGTACAAGRVLSEVRYSRDLLILPGSTTPPWIFVEVAHIRLSPSATA